MKDFVLILPEFFLAITAALLLFSEITHHGERVRLTSATALVGLAGAFVQTLISYRYESTQVFAGSAAIDGLTQFFRLLFIGLAGLSILSSTHTREIPESRRVEYQVLILTAALAMCWIASATDLLLAFAAVQLLNGVMYFVAGYSKRCTKSNEAGLKYMIMSSLAGAFLLYGFALLFLRGSLPNLHDLRAALGSSGGMMDRTVIAAFLLILFAICFQLAAFPMNLWAPDVVEGAPTPAGAFILVGSRAAGFALAMRVLLALFTQEGQPALKPLDALSWQTVTSVIAASSMLIGPLLALRQSSVKRMISALCIGTSGQLLVGLVVLDTSAMGALLYMLLIEMLALAGIFYTLSYFKDQLDSDQLSDFKGVLKKALPESVALILFLLCFVGLPPTPGFLGRFAIIGAAVRGQNVILGLVGIASWVLSVIAVVRLLFQLVGDFATASASEGSFAPSPQRKVFLVGLLVPMFFVTLFSERILLWVGRSVAGIFW